MFPYFFPTYKVLHTEKSLLITEKWFLGKQREGLGWSIFDQKYKWLARELWSFEGNKV